jgi:hypothetical protein
MIWVQAEQATHTFCGSSRPFSINSRGASG